MQPRVHAPEFKVSVCRQVQAGLASQAQVCREHRLAHSVLERWLQVYRVHGESAFEPRQPSEDGQLHRRVAELERLCGQLALENETLKRAVKRCRSASAMP
jgi:transposase-like protein